MPNIIVAVRALLTWWDTQVPGFIRDLVEAALSAGIGAAVLAYQAVDWSNPTLEPKVIVAAIAGAFGSAFIAYIRHHGSSAVTIGAGQLKSLLAVQTVAVDSGVVVGTTPVAIVPEKSVLVDTPVVPPPAP